MNHKERHDLRLDREQIRKGRGDRVSREYWVRFRGPSAFWGGLNTGPCKHSNIIPSHGALVGLMRCILGPWEIDWAVSELRLLQQPRELKLTTNDLKSFDTTTYQGTLLPKPIDAIRRRTPRTVVFLRGIDFAICARMVLTSRALEGDIIEKYEEMFHSRCSRQLVWKQMWFGTSDHKRVEFEFCDPTTLQPVDLSIDYGLQYFDSEYPDDYTARQYYAESKLEHGIVRFPPWERVRELNICRTVPMSIAPPVPRSRVS